MMNDALNELAPVFNNIASLADRLSDAGFPVIHDVVSVHLGTFIIAGLSVMATDELVAHTISLEAQLHGMIAALETTPLDVSWVAPDFPS